jgi:hypothetical protein
MEERKLWKKRDGREKVGVAEEDERERKKWKKREERYKCAADFSLLNLPKGKSLGRSKPATNS